MATCEMCGESGDLKKTRVEGTTLKLCEDCQDVGEVVETSSTTTTTSSTSRSRSRSRPPRGNEKDVATDAGERVKHARENQGWTIGDLAGKIKEKNSVVRRIESGKLTPDNKLINKLENTLDITLHEELSEVTADTDTAPTGEQTLGDVADVKNRE